MRVTALTVYMAMRDLLVGSPPHRNYLNVKVQGLSGQGVVKIDIHRRQADLDYGNRSRPEPGRDLRLLARTQCCSRSEILLRDPLAHVRTTFAIGLLRRYRHLKSIIHLPPLERLLQAGDDVAMTDQHRNRFTIERGLSSLRLAHWSDRIMEPYNVVVFDLHARLRLGRKGTAQLPHYPDHNPTTPAHARNAVLLSVIALLAACASTPQNEQAQRTSPAPAISAATQRANEVTLRALGLVGTPYVYGGNTPQGGFDCSGLVTFVYAEAAALYLPRTTAQMAVMPAEKVARKALRTGDLVFFSERDVPTHVGIYVGNGRFVHAPNEGGTVRLDELSNPYWNRNYRFSRRVID